MHAFIPLPYDLIWYANDDHPSPSPFVFGRRHGLQVERTGIIVAAGIVVAAVSGVTIYVCNVTTNKGEFLANFIINTGFSVLLMLVSFFMGAFCTLKKDRRTGILVAAGIVVATVSGATIYVYNVTANKGEFLANFIISTGVSVLLMLVSFFMLPQ
ncbi:hypothetical protein QR680_016725 [Steinernema hermaphroditum]|uniref:Uncharacterized protein n=1 Tax=Steinernema hermaphroditum TaxID=289476 RepID=A0AA39HC45_9BILA|nr:hypothetical protein QR680_016725 [Steinernema hermaphroditum]